MKKKRNELLFHTVKQGLQQHMSSGTYTCSMHPEVRSDKPDKCPKMRNGFSKEKIINPGNWKI